jgi:hypothetical protein
MEGAVAFALQIYLQTLCRRRRIVFLAFNAPNGRLETYPTRIVQN